MNIKILYKEMCFFRTPYFWQLFTQNFTKLAKKHLLSNLVESITDNQNLNFYKNILKTHKDFNVFIKEVSTFFFEFSLAKTIFRKFSQNKTEEMLLNKLINMVFKNLQLKFH